MSATVQKGMGVGEPCHVCYTDIQICYSIV